MDAKSGEGNSVGTAREVPASLRAAVGSTLRRMPLDVVSDARRVFVGGAPRVIVNDRTAAWHFTICADADAEYMVEVRIEAKPGPKHALAFDVRCRCECAYFHEIGTCAHAYAALHWLHGDLSGPQPSRPELIDKFLDACSSKSGNWYLGKLVKIVQEQEERRSFTQTRQQWRVSLEAKGPAHASAAATAPPPGLATLRIAAYEQKRQRRGGAWSPGRQVDWNHPQFLASCEHEIDDLRVASLLRQLGGRSEPAAGRGDGFSGRSDGELGALWEALPALAQHPNVVWNDRELTPLRILARRLRIECIDAPEGKTGEDFLVRLWLGRRCFFPPQVDRSGADVKVAEGMAAQEKAAQEKAAQERTTKGLRSKQLTATVLGGPGQPARVVVADANHRHLFYSQRLGQELAQWIAGLLAMGVDQFAIDAKGARQLMDIAGPLGKTMRIELPESICGPREPIPIAISLVMEPLEHGLRGRLRLSDPRLPEPLIPGTGAGELTVITPLGPRRWVRDLPAEQRTAAALEERLQLARLGRPVEREGHSWRVDDFEAAIELLELLGSMGDEAPAVLWPAGKKMRLLGEIAPASLRVRIEDRHDWFGIKGVVRFAGGEDVPLEQILKALRSGSRYVRVGEHAFARLSDAFRARLGSLEDVLQIDRQGAKVARVAAPLIQELLGEDCLLEATLQWNQTLQRLQQAEQLDPQIPAGLQADLREYQKDGYRWLARLSAWGAGGVLADDMGLGKTVQALGILLDRASAGPALVVAPTSVGENWVRETRRFTPALRPLLYRDHPRDQLVERAGNGDLVIVSYALLQRDIKKIASRRWQTMVLDEAQFIKNAATKTARATREIEADWRLALSGTPLENHLGELWSLMRTISPGLLGTWEHFRTRFADPIERGEDPQRRASLSRLMQGFILRRTKDKVLAELPPRTEINRFAELDDPQRKLYEGARMAAIEQLAGSPAAAIDDDPQRRFVVLSWLTKLRQLACHPRLVDPAWQGSSAKLDLFLETVDQLRDGQHRALVFSQFVQHLTLVREALDQRGIAYQYLDGGTPAAERQRRVDAFQQGDGDLFLISLKAGGTGLNLTAANYVIHLDPWWNPAVEDQATDRAHRIGQHRAVTVLRLIAENTIEEQILELHGDKRELVASILDGTDRAGKLSTAEMIDLIRSGGNEL